MWGVNTDQLSEVDVVLELLWRDMRAVAFGRPRSAQWRVTRVWGDTESILGCPRSLILGGAPKEFLSANDAMRFEQAHTSLRNPDDTSDLVLQLRCGDGRDTDPR